MKYFTYRNFTFFFFIFIFTFPIAFLLFILSNPTYAFQPKKAPTLAELNTKIALAQKYYEGLYRKMPNNEAIIAEYYSGNKSIYTVRHGVLGGYFYFSYIHKDKQAAALLNLAKKYGFDPYIDDHSFIWTNKSNVPVGIAYSLREYHDCYVKLPSSQTVSPYHSKVCKTGIPGEIVYSIFSHFDPLVPIETKLQELEHGQKVSTTYFENKYNQLGFGIPICTPLGCSTIASTIRTAQFGELELKLGNMQYADAVAYDLIHAEDKNGAIYIAYNSQYKLDNKKSFIYLLIDLLFNDKPIFTGIIPSNAESMNDSLAFLMQYRTIKYKMCK